MIKFFTLFIGISLLIFMPMRTVQAAIFDVCPSDFADFTTTINTANTNTEADTINFTCDVTLTFSSILQIMNDAGNGIVINANGFNVIFDGANNTPFFVVNGGTSLTLDGITLQNGSTVSDGVIYNGTTGTLIINNSTFMNNFANNGGVIANTAAGTLIINNSIFTGNSADISGGAIGNFGTLTISDSTFTNNSADSGGAITNFGTVTISNTSFNNNSTGNTGGAITSNNTLTINDSSFTGNFASSIGGAIYNITGTASISNTSFTNNSTNNSSGAIHNIAGLVNIDSSTFSGNTATFGGVMVNVSGGTVNISDSAFTSNAALTEGGAISNADGTVNISNSTLSGNSAPDGGAIFNDVTVNSAGTAYTNNTCEGAGTYNDNGGNTATNALGCPGAISTEPPAEPVVPIAPVVLPPDPFALGCVLTQDVNLAGASDNTYCRILMKNGAIVGYSGAVPSSLIGLGVKLAVDVYRLDGGQSVVDFDGYSRICLSGAGRLFYLDARGTPRSIVELATESLGGATCGWIPAAGTLVLTD